jgi:SAM-dependent methyltransferase
MRLEQRHLTADELRADFDRIARVDPRGSSPQLGHHAWIELRLPPPPARALDLGCGTGSLTRLLATRCGDALGVDLSPVMLDAARSVTPPDCPARYVLGDFRDTPPRGETFDVVTAVAALHHLPLDESLALAASRVRPGGMLLVVDLYDSPRLPVALRHAEAWILAHWDAFTSSREALRPEVRAAWRAHGDRERLPDRAEVRAAAARLAPAPDLRFHLRWRWTLAWRRSP